VKLSVVKPNSKFLYLEDAESYKVNNKNSFNINLYSKNRDFVKFCKYVYNAYGYLMNDVH